MTQPDLADRLVLLGPTVDRDARSMRQQFERLLRDAPRESLRLVSVVIGDYLRSGPVWTLRTARLMVEYKIEDVLPQVAAPTLIIRGSRDPIAPQKWVDEIVRLMPNAQALRIEGAAHAAHFVAADCFLGAIRPFLDSVDESIDAA